MAPWNVWQMFEPNISPELRWKLTRPFILLDMEQRMTAAGFGAVGFYSSIFSATQI